MDLKAETLANIDRAIPKYPEKRSAVMPVLHAIQQDQGYISNDAIEWAAGRLDLEPINVYEVVTFYPFFRQHPIGKKHIRVCRTLPCALSGAYKVCDAFKEEFKCDLNEISPGGEVTIEFAECLASCGTAPVALVDEELHHNLTPEKVKDLAADIRAEVKSGKSSSKKVSKKAAKKAVKKVATKKTTAKKTAPATPAKKVAAKKETPARKAVVKKEAPVKKAAKKAVKKAVATKAPTKKAAAKKAPANVPAKKAAKKVVKKATKKASKKASR